MIKILLVEDQLLVRKGIIGLLKLNPDFKIISEAEDGEEALNKILTLKPDVVLMDIQLPKMTGIEVLQQLSEQEQLVPTILLTTFDDNRLFEEGMKAGAMGYLLKDVSIEMLSETIYKVAAGEKVFRPAITEKVIQKIQNSELNFESTDFNEKLTKREIEILRLISSGYSNKEIAEMLCISAGVVKNYTSSIFTKFGVRDRTRAVLKAIEQGLI